jgi:single-strand DNA-binding protein
MNSAVIVGRAGKDAELKNFESGKSRATFTVAVNRWDPKTSSNITDWFNIDAWDRQAEFASNYVKKGQLYEIEGRIRTNSWTDQTGSARQTYLITASRIGFASSKKDVE